MTSRTPDDSIKGRLLIVEDDPDTRTLMLDVLSSKGHRVSTQSSAEGGLGALEGADFDAVLTDLQLDGMDGLALCSHISRDRPDVPVIVVTGFGSMDTAVGAIRAGAYDFLTKPIDIDALQLRVERALQHRSLNTEVKRLRLLVQKEDLFPELLGTSPPVQKMKALLTRVAESDVSVLITGESGTGKELAARAIHRFSPRAAGPFVAVNCAAVPETILESELFGHRRGAFTDAKADRVGLFVQARGGTLFLDEIGEMPLSMQSKLLRTLQERRVRPVGADEEVPFDARLVTATNRDLEADILDKRFREDLYYRINVVRIEMPPLRARGKDILLLAQSFLEAAAARGNKPVRGFVRAVADRMLTYDWPGNVRELANCVEHAVALAQHDTIMPEDLPEKIKSYTATELVSQSNDPTDLVSMDEVERRYILRVLKAVGDNKTQAARLLGFERRTLYRKLSRYGIE